MYVSIILIHLRNQSVCYWNIMLLFMYFNFLGRYTDIHFDFNPVSCHLFSDLYWGIVKKTLAPWTKKTFGVWNVKWPGWRTWRRGGDENRWWFRRVKKITRWWFQTFVIFTPIWGRFPFWLIFFRWVGSTTNQIIIICIYPPTQDAIVANKALVVGIPKPKNVISSWWLERRVGG